MKIKQIPLHVFSIPAIILVGIICSIVTPRYLVQNELVSNGVLLIVIGIGSFGLVRDTWQSLRSGNFALDYIALLAITVGIISGEYLVAAVITLMLTGGEALEDYSMERAKASLTALVDRLPSHVLRWQDEKIGEKVHIDTVLVGQTVYIRKGEVFPLDGILTSAHTYCDESSLTGEALPVAKHTGDKIHSGTVNMGEGIVVQVTTASKNSTYRAIVDMVQKAQASKSPFIRLADQYSGWFTVIALVIAGGAYWLSHGDLTRVLAVLVIATPCPLILATPIALMGGMSAAGAQRIIFKKLGTIEQLARVRALIFDKTGTITMGHPMVTNTVHIDETIPINVCNAIALALERGSLHPLAKALVHHIQRLPHNPVQLADMQETVGKGISGTYDGAIFRMGAAPEQQEGMALSLYRDEKEIVRYHLQDTLKSDSRAVLKRFIRQGMHLAIYTGDTQENAHKMKEHLGVSIDIEAHCKPADKIKGVDRFRTQGYVTGMVGDGINDAPALAHADVGMVFGSQDNTAATEAADVVFLGSEIKQLERAIAISQHTIHIARQSIVVGIVLSTIGMVLASAGYIPPVVGAFIQEAIDVSVIFNALRASRLR